MLGSDIVFVSAWFNSGVSVALAGSGCVKVLYCLWLDTSWFNSGFSAALAGSG